MNDRPKSAEIGVFSVERQRFHTSLSSILTDDKGIPTNADKHNKVSVNIAAGILDRLGLETYGTRKPAQSSGSIFEKICAEFLEATFHRLIHLRPGKWIITSKNSGQRRGITQYAQYEHLAKLEKVAKDNPELDVVLGQDYLITPDVIIVRETEEDDVINSREFLADDFSASRSSLRGRTQGKPILHASISCKWTLRSDRAQNARSEALNLIRNRKGRLPHIVAVTGEPTPKRIASIALGTGDIDCVYHFALQELIDTVKKLNIPKAEKLLWIMVEGERLKDISDLPLDLAV